MSHHLIDTILQIESSTHKVFKNNDVITSAGSKDKNCYYIRSGYVKVYDLNSNGTIKIIGILTKDEMFPLIWGFDHPSETVYYYKAFGVTEVASVETTLLRQQLDENPVISRNAMLQFVYLTWDFMERIKGLQMPYTYEKLVRLMPYLAAKLGKKIAANRYDIMESMTQEEIAQMIGVTRESISAHMSRLEEEKIVRRKGSHLSVDLANVPEEYIHDVWFNKS